MLKTNFGILYGLMTLIAAVALCSCGKQGLDVATCEKGRINFKRYYEENPKRVDEIASEVMGDKAGESIAANMSDLKARELQIKMLEEMLKEIKVPAECAEYFLEMGIPESKAPDAQPGAEGAQTPAGTASPATATVPAGSATSDNAAAPAVSSPATP